MAVEQPQLSVLIIFVDFHPFSLLQSENGEKQ